jgi:hypothetical protein
MFQKTRGETHAMLWGLMLTLCVGFILEKIKINSLSLSLWMCEHVSSSTRFSRYKKKITHTHTMIPPCTFGVGPQAALPDSRVFQIEKNKTIHQEVYCLFCNFFLKKSCLYLSDWSSRSGSQENFRV